MAQLRLRRQPQNQAFVSFDEGRVAAEQWAPPVHETDGHAADAAANTVAAATQGAMFIAGFAYYELGRFGVASGHQDRPYLVLLTGALVSAILAAAVGGAFASRAAVCDAAAPWRGAVFARSGVWVVRATHRYYLLAVTLYLASLSRVGHQYFEPGPCRLVPAVFAGAALAAFVSGYHIVVGSFLRIVSKEADPPVAGAACPRATYLHQQGSAISTLMIFVMSFGQAAVTRFAPHAGDNNSDLLGLGVSLQAGLYLVSSALAFSCAAFAVFSSCSILVYLYDLEGAAQKELFAGKVQGVWGCVQLASLLALLSFNVCFATVGWGVGYTANRYIPAVLGYFSLMVLCGVALTLLHAALTPSVVPRETESDDALTERTQLVEAKLHTIALRSSVTAGYVWYHIASFATDVDNYDAAGAAFLAVHAAAFALGLTATTVAHVTCMSLSNARNDSRFSMVQRAQVIERVVGGFYWLSLVFFVIGFGMIGPVKRGTQVTSALAVLALVGLAVTVLVLRWPRGRDTGNSVDAPDGERDVLVRSSSEAEMSSSQENTTQQNERLADQAFQFGSLGYFCALFLDPEFFKMYPRTLLYTERDATALTSHAEGLKRQVAVLYCWTMGGSFTVALSLVALSTVMSITNAKPDGEWLGRLFRWLHWYALTSFQLGFILLGAQGYTYSYTALVCSGGVLVLLASVLCRTVLPRMLQPHSHTTQLLSQPAWKQLISAFRAKSTSFSTADPRLPGCPVTHVSDGFLQLTGYTRDDVIGVNCRFLQGPKTDKSTVARVRAAVANGEDISVRLLNYRKDKSQFWNLLQLEHVRNRHGESTQIIGRQMDITEDMKELLRGDSVRLASPRAAVNWRRLRSSFVDRVAAGTAPSAVLQLQFGSTVKQLQALQAESCFVASNVFFELLFARSVEVDGPPSAVYLGGATMTFCLAAIVHIVSSTTLAFTASHSALDSSSAAVRASRQVALGAMALMLCCMLSWMASVSCSASIKYPEHWGVTAVWGGGGLVLMVLHLIQISAISRCANTMVHPQRDGSTGGDAEMDRVEVFVCWLLRVSTDGLMRSRLWCVLPASSGSIRVNSL